MKTVVVQYKVKADRADENAELIRGVCREFQATNPDRFRYMTLQLSDGETFVHIASFDSELGQNVFDNSAAFQEFRRELPDRAITSPSPTPAIIVGSFGFPGMEPLEK